MAAGSLGKASIRQASVKAGVGVAFRRDRVRPSETVTALLVS